VAQKLGVAVAQTGEQVGTLAKRIDGYVREPANRKQVIAGAVGVAILLVMLTDNPITSIFSKPVSEVSDAPPLTEAGLPDLVGYRDIFIGDEEEYIVTGTANVRDFPTSEGTTVIQTFTGGETVLAREVSAFDPSSQWFKLSNGGYIWGGNLEGIGLPSDSSPSLTASVFPPWSQGHWSSKDFCPQSNGGSIYVVIEGDRIYVNGNGSQISDQFQDAADTLYSIKPIDAQDQFEMTISLRPSADGRHIVLEHIEPHEIEPWLLFQEGLPCNQLVRN